MSLPSVTADTHRMQCMEVWGGHEAVDRSVKMTGIDVRAFSRVYRDSERGGDVLYISSCASGRISRVLLADVSGHGGDAQRVAESLRNLMRNNINRIDQSRMMSDVNREFAATDDKGRFATAVLLTYFLPTQSLAVSLAGHPTPLIYRGAHRRWECLHDMQTKRMAHASGLPFGVSDDECYGTVKIGLGPEDIVLCYSDAFIEAVGPNGKMLGIDGLLTTLRTCEVDSPDILVPRLVETIEAFDAENLRSDDATAVVLTRNQDRVSLRDNLLAPGRWLSTIIGRFSHT